MTELEEKIVASLRVPNVIETDAALAAEALQISTCPSTPLIGETRVCRFDTVTQAYPFLDRIVLMINRNLPPENHRIGLGDIARPTTRLADGRIIRLDEYWNGTTFALVNGETVQG